MIEPKRRDRMRDLDAWAWPAFRLGEAMAALARKSGLSSRPADLPSPPEGLAGDRERLARWMAGVADGLGIEAEPVESSYAEIDRLVRGAGPALLRLPGRDKRRFLALLRGAPRRVVLLGPDLSVRRLRPEVISRALCEEVEAPLTAEVDRLLDETGISKRRRAHARAAILRERLGAVPAGDGWLLRLPPGASFWRQMRHARLTRRLLVLVAAHALQYLLWLLSWWTVGAAALQGRFDRGWLWAWVLLLLTLVPFRLLATWSQGLLALGAGGLLKRRLLYGALRLDPEAIRHQGVGQLLGRVIESEAVESLALSGGFLGSVAAVELVAAAVVLGTGAGGGRHVLLLLGWTAATGFIGWRYLRPRRRWTAVRLHMTNDLVEGMVGHRTRLAQGAPERWHESEDQALERYVELSQAMDRAAMRLTALVPRGWQLIGLLGLAPAFVTGRASPAALAVGLGGVLLAYRALARLAAGLVHLGQAALAWEQAAPLFRAAAHAEPSGAWTLAPAYGTRAPESGPPILEAHDLTFRYHPRGDFILRGCTLQVRRGDRILLEGPSGGGKSTLASLLMGLRTPESGLLLLDGLDRRTLGAAGWRVVAAPQFHENYVLTETFAFNLLMGRRWPPQPEDLQEAESLCRELGLDELLARMPAGLMQRVGETGWQLSHGERSRLYIARALLQSTDVIILDESFAALDPESLHRSLRCVLRRAATLLVIAHP